MAKPEHRKHGLSMIELLCVIAIIAILLALYLGPISKAFVHVKKVMGN
jgi:prepilin-type N-terminal cleavage/methylation domain-containing protein